MPSARPAWRKEYDEGVRVKVSAPWRWRRARYVRVVETDLCKIVFRNGDVMYHKLDGKVIRVA